MNGFVLDLRQTLRRLGRSPAFAVTVVLTLALGIGANTLIWSLVDGVLLRPLDYGEPDRLLLVWNRMKELPQAPISAPDVADIRTEIDAFEDVAASDNVVEVTVTGEGSPEMIRLAQVTWNYFSVLQVDPAFGRTFVPEESKPLPPPAGASPEELPAGVVVLSHGFWQHRLGGDPDVIGAVLRFGGAPYEVIGVLPESFRLLMPATAGMPTNIDAWTTFRFDFSEGQRDSQNLRVVARLAEEETIDDAQQQLDRLAEWQRETFEFHRNKEMGLIAQPMRENVVAHVRTELLLLLAAVGFVLLVACANVANLLLVRLAGRRHELSIRSALGAGRRRLLRAAWLEPVVLAVIGGALGIGLAYLGLHLLQSGGWVELPRLQSVTIDRTALSVATGLTVGVALLFAAIPALLSLLPSSSRSTLTRRDERTGSAGRVRRGLVIAELAVSIVLLVGAGLLLRSFAELLQEPIGFEIGSTLSFGVNLPFPSYPGVDRRVEGIQRIEAAVSELPGVEEAGAVFPLPLSGRFWTGPYGHPEGEIDDWTRNEADFRMTTPGYLEAMGIELVEGRTFEQADLTERREVAVVDRKLASQMWPGRSAVGQELGMDLFGNRHVVRVIGVVEPIQHDGVGLESRPMLYWPHHFFPFPQIALVVRSAQDPKALIPAIEKAVMKLDPDLPIYNIHTMDEAVTESLAARRFTLALVGGFAATALLLGAMGLYGVIAYSVRLRRREIGIRLAMGADRRSILGLVAGEGLRVSIVGVVIGIGVALLLGRFLAGLLFGVAPWDPVTFAAVVAVQLVVALVAAVWPARRALRTDPMAELRDE